MGLATSRRELCAFIASSSNTIVHGPIRGYDFSAFKVDPRARDAVIYRLAVIGETANSRSWTPAQIAQGPVHCRRGLHEPILIEVAA